MWPWRKSCLPVTGGFPCPGACRPLKQVLREKGVPPWARDRVLLLELSGQIVFCEGIGPAEGFGAERGKDALMVTVKA